MRRAVAAPGSSGWRPAWLLAVVVLWAGLSCFGVAVRAQEGTVPPRRIGISWNGSVPRLSFSARDMANREVRRKLQSGLPQNVVLRVYAFRTGGRAVAAGVLSCRVVYDLWEEVYRVQIQSGDEDRSELVESMDEVLDRCLVVKHLRVGHPEEWQPRRGQDVYFAVVAEFNPLSQDTVERIRRWLARPAGGSGLQGDAFFGSFVSLFVNRRIGDAERVIRFRSQPIAVP